MKTIVCAGNSLELELPKRENVQDWTISRDTDLAWLAGILDGEGFIGISRTGTKIVKRVSITNTDYELLQKVSRVYAEMNMRFFWNWCSPKNRNEQFMILTVSSYGSIKRLLNAVMPYLTSKSEQAKKMLSFIAYRESIPYHSPEFFSGEKMEQYIADLKAMKAQKPGLSTTARIASQPLPEMVVQSGLQ